MHPTGRTFSPASRTLYKLSLSMTTTCSVNATYPMFISNCIFIALPSFNMAVACRNIRNHLIEMYGQAGCNANEIAILVEETLGAKIRYKCTCMTCTLQHIYQ